MTHRVGVLCHSLPELAGKRARDSRPRLCSHGRLPITNEWFRSSPELVYRSSHPHTVRSCLQTCRWVSIEMEKPVEEQPFPLEIEVRLLLLLPPLLEVAAAAPPPALLVLLPPHHPTHWASPAPAGPLAGHISWSI